VISFRFQVVALTAVFGAIAGGLLLGAAAQGRSASEAALRDQANAAAEEGQQLRDRLAHLDTDVNARERFAQQVAPAALAGRLAAARVLLVVTRSGESYVDGVREMLDLAGASVTGRVGLGDLFLDPGQTDALQDLATAALPPSVVGGLPVGTDGVTTSSALLAAVLLNRTPAVAAEDQRSVLTAYASRGYVTGIDTVTGPADAVVVVTGGPQTGPAATARNGALLSLVAQFGQAGRAVVTAASDAGTGNVVAQLRTGPRPGVSTVDNVATPQGRLVTALAVAEQLAGRSGHYGVGTGALLVPPTVP
jgi:hypothetical protein